ncbi:homeobox protein onecut isoform X1 [Drosophila albomicans]|uniref:One cut domain family member n=1 Tax=Drosophila albomicans TaxID=7291 RepID=A0A6P8Z5X4_DROAB|nr:homeobox protein onecut isoform X1 [Drosophila albomicans]XP_051862192.1 homeobox protein onecut isoform X1 [Drosophila albomicans]
MESISEIIDSETFCHQLVDESTEFIAVGPGRGDGCGGGHARELECECENVETLVVKGGIKYLQYSADESTTSEAPAVLSNVMRKLIGAPTTPHDDNRIHSPDDETRSVVMVIDEMQNHNVETTYQLVPQQSLQLQGGRTLPLSSLLPIHQHQRPDRMVENCSPADFVSTDLSLDGLTVSTSSQIVAVKDEEEHRLVIVHGGEHCEISIDNPNSSHIDISRTISNINVIDELSSDGSEEVTLNQHHQQLLEEQHQHYNHQEEHQQYSHRLIHQQQDQQRRQQEASVQLGIGHHNNIEHHHRETLSVIVQTQVDVGADDEEEDVDDDDDDNDDEHDSPLALGSVDNSLEHSTYQTLTSVNNNHRISPPPFSPTSYATLTPIQPLPPISTMSDKFAYSGHISGSATSSSGNGNNSSINNCRINGRGSADGSSNDCASFSSLPSLPSAVPQQSGSLGSLSLSSLGRVQSPYSSLPYDKLPSLISPPPPLNYTQSPSHGIGGIVGSTSPVGAIAPVCEALSPHHNSTLRTSGNINNNQQTDHQTMNVICLSPGAPASIGDGGVDSNFKSSTFSKTHASQTRELLMATATSSSSTSDRCSQSRSRLQQLQQIPTPPMLSPHSVTASGSVMSISQQSSPHMNGGTVPSISVDLPVIDALSRRLSPIPPPARNDVSSISVANCDQNLGQSLEQQRPQLHQAGIKTAESNTNNGHVLANIPTGDHLNVCISQQQQQRHQPNGPLADQQQQPKSSTTSASNGTVISRTNTTINEMEEINTKELAQRISAELKRYSIPQAIFAQRVLCRSQGTLSDLLRNPKPWSKLKSGRETFRRMFKWLQEPEFQRMSALRLAAAQIPQRQSSGTTSTGSVCNITPTESNTPTSSSTVSNTVYLHAPSISANCMGNTSACASASESTGQSNSTNCRRKEEPQIEQMPQPKKPRLVFTDLQRRTLQAIFKETKRPSKEMQVTIARQLGLEPTTVGNFFMNARRRSMDKWREDDIKNNIQQMRNNHQQDEPDERESNIHEQSSLGHYENLHTTAISPLGTFDDDGEMDLDLENPDFLVDEHDDDDQDML